MSDISAVCIGAAVQDVFLHGQVLKPHKEADGSWVEEFPLGAKLDLDGITYSTGGGATNGAVTFSKQGFKVKMISKIGHDPAGDAVLSDMRKYKINTRLAAYSKRYKTGYSALLVAPNGERTILTYRGASSNYRMANFEFDKIQADWMFVTTLAGNMEVLEALVKHAHSRHIKVAMIPGKKELKNATSLKKLLPMCHVLSANLEEMQMLFPGDFKEQVAVNAAQVVPVSVVTDGQNGVAACDGKVVVSAGMYEDVPVLDRTGAGDAFASGFVAKTAQGKSLGEAITFASANSTSVVNKIGAKDGILPRNAHLHEMDLHEQRLDT